MQKAQNRQDYLIQIIESLASEYKNISERQNSQQSSSGIKTLPGKKQKDCCVCSNRKKTETRHKRTRTIYVKCGRGLHGTCLSMHKCK